MSEYEQDCQCDFHGETGCTNGWMQSDNWSGRSLCDDCLRTCMELYWEYYG